MSNTFEHLKDADSIKVSNLFNQLLSEAYQLPREDLTATTVVPMQSGLSPWIKSFSFKKVKELGMAKLVADYALDLPPVSRGIELKTVPVHTGGDSWHLSEPDVQAWLTAGENIDTDERDTARRKLDELLDEVILKGDAARGIEGFVNNSNVPVVTIKKAGKWNTKTRDEIVADLGAAIDAVYANTNRTSKVDSVGLPHDAFAYISRTKVSSNLSTTILEDLKATFPQIKNWYELSALEGVGASGADRLVVYKKDASCVAYAAPVPFKQMAPQYKGLCYTVNCYSRIAGTVWKRPTTAAYMDGV